MKTILVPPASLNASQAVPVSMAELRHLRVRRAADGETVRLTDGEGAVARGTLELSPRTAVVHIDGVERMPRPARLVLAVGAGDRERFRWLVDKAAEVGVTDLIPLETDRCRAVANRVRASHIARLGTRAREAIKQSGSAWAPVVVNLTPLREFLRAAPAGTRWVADAAGTWPGQVPAQEPVIIAVGPEGGFTAEETSAVTGAGFRPVRLSPLTLRFETAAITAAAYASIQRQRKEES